MRMYLVLCYDPHAKEWFAYSGAVATRGEARRIITEAPVINYINDRPIKYKILDFWMPSVST